MVNIRQRRSRFRLPFYEHLIRTLILGIVILTCTTGCVSHREALLTGHLYRLYFPRITLATVDGERIESVEVTVSCGRFRSLTVIPNDWSAEVVSPMSEKTIFRAGAGHGVSTLWSLRDLDGAVTISVEEASCFDITATVGTTASEHRFSRSDLLLNPCQSR